LPVVAVSGGTLVGTQCGEMAVIATHLDILIPLALFLAGVGLTAVVVAGLLADD
jgi:hypothetical protein